MSVSNYERLLRTFVEDNSAALIALDVDVEEYSTDLYRRTTATLVERAAGITLASRLLRHANEQITRELRRLRRGGRLDHDRHPR